MSNFIKQRNLHNLPKFEGVTCDSRKVKPGYAFVAIKGLQEDGHDYIEEAINNGARIIFAEKKYPGYNTNFIKVNDSRKALALLAAKYYDNPAQKLKLIGVTGTNGKTTTTHLIYNLLNHIEKTAGLIGTVKIDDGNQIQKGDLTTPPPVQLQKTLKKMVDNNLKYACMEVSSHGIKLKRITGVPFNVKVGTNISSDHFNFHGDLNDYIHVKKTFLEDKLNSLVLINRDDLHLQSLGRIARNQLYYGIKTSCPITASNITRTKNYTHFTYQIKGDLSLNKNYLPTCKFRVKTRLFGYHNIYNALITITIALYFGIPLINIKKFFNEYPGVWRRMQVIYNDDFNIIDDCAHNPASYRAVFNSLKHFSYNNVIIVNAPRGNRGLEINKANALTLINCLQKINNYQLLICNCRDTAKQINQVTSEEEKVFLECLQKNKIEYQHFLNLKPALKKALSLTEKDDLIMLLGPKSMDSAGDMIKSMLENN